MSMSDGSTEGTDTAEAPAPANGAEKSNGAAKPVKPDSRQAFGEFVKTHGPVKFKANGKEREVDSWDVLTQRLAQSAGYEEKLRSVEAERQKEAVRLQRIDAAKKAAPADTWKMLAEEFTPEQLNKAAEAYYSAELAREKESQALSPEARRYKEEAERTKSELSKREAEIQQQTKERERQQLEAQTAEVAKYLDGVIGEALADSGLKSESAAYFMPHVAAMVARADQLGLEVSPQSIAQEVFRVQQEMTVNLLGKLQPGKVLDLLESITIPGANGQPGTTLRKEMMREYMQRRNRPAQVEQPEQEESPDKPKRAPAQKKPSTRNILDFGKFKF